MKINRRLNLVQPIETESGTIHLHSTPIALETWETYFLIISKTYAAIFAEGLQMHAGPTIAGLMLRRIAEANNMWDGPNGVRMGLLPEIRRLSNVVLPTGAIPYEVALQQGLIDEDTVAEVEGAVIFFICASAVLRGPSTTTQEKLRVTLGMMELMYGVRTTSLDCMAFAASLQTSTPAETIGEKKQASSVPY